MGTPGRTQRTAGEGSLKRLLRSKPGIGQPEAFQGQVLVDMLDFGNNRSHQLRQAAMGNDFDLALVCFSYSRYLMAQAMNETLHEADMPIDDAGLQVLDG